jgi:hypothetical protein
LFLVPQESIDCCAVDDDDVPDLEWSDDGVPDLEGEKVGNKRLSGRDCSTADCCAAAEETSGKGAKVMQGGKLYHLLPNVTNTGFEVSRCRKIADSIGSEALISVLVQQMHGKWAIFSAEYLSAAKTAPATTVLLVEGICCASEVRPRS